VERALILSDSPHVRLWPLISTAEVKNGASACDRNEDILAKGFHRSVDDYKRKLLQEALRRTGGSKKEAAAALGLSPSNLSHLLKKLEIKTK